MGDKWPRLVAPDTGKMRHCTQQVASGMCARAHVAKVLKVKLSDRANNSQTHTHIADCHLQSNRGRAERHKSAIAAGVNALQQAKYKVETFNYFSFSPPVPLAYCARQTNQKK